MALTKVRGSGLGTLGDGTANDVKILFDGNAQDYHIGLDDSTDSLTIGLGSALGTTAHIISDANGHVTQPLQPSIAMDGDGTGATSFSGSDRLITEWTSLHTVGITYTSSNGRFTVPSDGKYLITVHIYLYQNDVFQRLHILDNDSTFVHSSADYNNSDADIGQDNTLSCTVIRDLSANDYITFTLLDGGGRYLMLAAHSHMSMHKLS